MCTQIHTIDNCNLDNSHTLLYASNKYYLHIIDINTNAATEIQIEYPIPQPKFISSLITLRYVMWWQIIDVYNKIHCLMITNDGKIIFKSQITTTNDNNTLLAIYPTTTGHCSSHVLYYLDEHGDMHMQHYNYITMMAYGNRVISFGISDQLPKYLLHQVEESNVEHIGRTICVTIEDEIYKINYDDYTLTQVDDYPYHQSVITFERNNNIYTYNKCLSTLYKNDTIIHKFDKPYNMAYMTHRTTKFSQFVIYFVSKNEITYVLDNHDLITIHKLHIDDVKFIDNINVPSVINFKHKIKSQMITFMMANKIVSNKIPKLLLYKIISLLDKIDI